MAFSNKITKIKSFNLFNSFSTIKCFDLFWVIFLLRFDNLAWKSVFVIKLACANFALKASEANLLNSEVSVYLSWLWLLSLFSISLTLVLHSVFLTKLLTSGIFFSIAVNAVFVAKLLISRIFLILFYQCYI